MISPNQTAGVDNIRFAKARTAELFIAQAIVELSSLQGGPYASEETAGSISLARCLLSRLRNGAPAGPVNQRFAVTVTQ